MNTDVDAIRVDAAKNDDFYYIEEVCPQPDVSKRGFSKRNCVEVRMELADWMLRNQIPTSDALDQLQASADFLLDIEEENEAMNSPDVPGGEQRSVMSKRSMRSAKSADRKGGGSQTSGKRSAASAFFSHHSLQRKSISINLQSHIVLVA